MNEQRVITGFDQNMAVAVDIMLPCGCKMPSAYEIRDGMLYFLQMNLACPLHDEKNYL